MNEIVTRLQEQIRASSIHQNLFEPGQVVVAVSGGADSLTLLHTLNALRHELNISLHVATFDHQLRGAASAADVQFVRELADNWNLPVTVGAEDVPAMARKWSMGMEAAARRARYTFLLDVARQIDSRQIALGHNQDDQAETVLLHVIRGSGLSGLRGMLPKTWREGIALVRPLLDVARADIDSYIQALGIQPRVDLSNADPAYTRNYLRQTVLPLLETINPQVRKTLARSAAIARDDYEALQQTLPPLETHGPELWIGRERFLELFPAQRRLLIRLAAQKLSAELEISYERTLNAVDLITEHTHGVSARLDGDIWLRVSDHKVVFFAKTGYPADCPWMEAEADVQIEGAGRYKLPGADNSWWLDVQPIESGHDRDLSSPLTIILVVPDMYTLELRTRQAGDRFSFATGQSQKLSDTLINMKIAAHWRNRIPLLIVNGEVCGFIAPTVDGPKIRVTPQGSNTVREQRWRFAFFEIGSDSI